MSKLKNVVLSSTKDRSYEIDRAVLQSFMHEGSVEKIINYIETYAHKNLGIQCLLKILEVPRLKIELLEQGFDYLISLNKNKVKFRLPDKKVVSSMHLFKRVVLTRLKQNNQDNLEQMITQVPLRQTGKQLILLLDNLAQKLQSGQASELDQKQMDNIHQLLMVYAKSFS